MSLVPGLVNSCLLAEGFPRNISPVEVINTVSRTTGAAIDKVALLPVSRDSSAIWLVHLHSANDQMRCLMHHRTFMFDYQSQQYRIKLEPPNITLTSTQINWQSADEMAENRFDSIATEDMYGDQEDMDDRETDSMWMEVGLDPGNNPTYGQPNVPAYQKTLNTEKETAFQNVTSQVRGQHNRSFQPLVYPVDVRGQQEYDHDTSDFNPDRLPYSFDPGSSSSQFQQTLGFDQSHQEQQHFPQHLKGRGRGLVNPALGQSQSFMPPGHKSAVKARGRSPTYPTTSTPPQQERTETHPEGFGDLNLRHDEVQYPGLDQQQHINIYDQCTDGAQYYSDFEVLESSDSVGSNQHRQFCLQVTQLPDGVTEWELREFFQDRKQTGGGPVSGVNINPPSRSAVVFFTDYEVINRVVQRSPLLFKNKMIQVALVSTQQQQEEEKEEMKTVEIRGLNSEGETEMCIYYFENPSKGGGDIENSEWNEEDKIFFITFCDPKVAEAVVSRGHKIGSKVLEVNLYIPPVEEAADDSPQCTVEVRGIEPDNKELYEMYFSNPKKGGDTIVDLQLSEDCSVLYIEFETPEVAQRIAERPHTVGGKQLDVIVAPKEEPTPASTVIVKGCDLDNEELYQLYFENPKKGGGDIANLEVDKEQQAILITFVEPEVAQTVISMQHKVGGRSLEVSMYTPKKGSAKAKRPKSPEPAEKDEEDAPPRTVVVSSQQHPLESEDTYSLYFESKRSGGGDVEQVEIDEDKQCVYITFMDYAAAARVAEKKHKISGHPVTVELYIPPKPRPTYQDKLLFRNVADSTSKDCLVMYIERVTGQDPLEVMYGDEVGTVLVTFEEEPDFDKTVAMCQKRPLEKRKLTVSKVPISNCLLVENLSDKTTEDTICFYFENQRKSKGGPVEKVDMVPEENRCFVYFEDHEVLDGVLSQKHKIDGSHLSVKRYMECLGPSGGSEDPTAFAMPKPLVLATLDRYKVAFLRELSSAKRELIQELSALHAQIRFESSTLVVDCTLTSVVPKARILARTWTVDVEQSVRTFLSLVEVFRREVMQQLWQEVESAVRAADITCPQGVTLFTLPEETVFVVVGMKTMAKELFDDICSIIKSKEEEIERKKQEITDINSKLKPSQLSLLNAVGFHTEAIKRHEGLSVEIQKEKNAIVFHGLLKHVKEAQVEMYDILQNMKSQKIPSMTDMQRRVLENSETRLHVTQKFKNENISAVWEFNQQGELTVHAFEDPSLVKAVHIINKSVPEHVCQLNPESSEVLRSPDWQSLVKRLTVANTGVLMIAPSHDSRQVFITCIDSIMHGVVEEVDKFLIENTVYTQVVCFSPSRQLFVYTHWQHKLKRSSEALKAYRVQLTMPDKGAKFMVKGTRKGLDDMKQQLVQLNDQILCHAETFSDPSKVKLLNSDCKSDLERIGRSSRTVLTLQSEPSGLQVLESSSQAAMAPVPRTGGMQTRITIQHPSGVSISVVEGDITQMNVDTIVNAANNRMDHVGGLARDIVQKGGEVIQKDCYRILQSKGSQLKEGDVLESTSGRLPCKSIIHAVGPMYKGGHSGEEDCLYETVMKCLETANTAGRSSIAIPAISTGIFGYPAKESTRVIVESVKAFFDSRRRAALKSVYLCHIGADIVGLFTTALQKIFPAARTSSTVHSRPSPQPRTAVQQYQPQFTRTSGSNFGTAGPSRIINVSIIPGEIAKQTADVIVNSTSNGLDLQNGAVSSSILKAAGMGLQAECRSSYPAGIQTGEVAHTAGHGLSCREVFHVVLCNYNNTAAQQILHEIVTTCLTEASKQQYTSLAFPVLGTGNLGFPAQIVARTMLGAMDNFQRNVPSTSLKDVRIVVYPSDTKNLQVFQAEQGSMGSAYNAPPVPRNSNLRSTRVFSGGANNPAPAVRGQASSTANAEFDIGGLRFVIKQGDITEENVDAIVNSTNSQLDLSRGGVASALRKKCGAALEQECRGKVDEIQHSGIAVTRAHNLKSRIIVHINADRFSDSWDDGIEECLEVAERNGVNTIAMPAFGTGIGLSVSASALAMFRTVVKKYRDGPVNVKEVRVVLFDKKMVPQFVGAVQHAGEKHNKSNQGFFNRIKSAFTGPQAEVKQTVNNPVQDEVTLYIYGEKQSDVNEALKDFDEVAQEKFTRKVIRDDQITSLGSEDIQKMHQIAERHHVELKIEQWTGKITADGMHKEVFECMQELSGVLRDADRRQQLKEAAAMLANMIQWCYLEVTNTGTERREYEPRENHTIEMAFQGKKRQAEIKDNAGNVYIIDFNSMREYPKGDISDFVSVMRRDKIKDLAGGQIPDFWIKQSPSETVKLVPLQASDQEYMTAATAFTATVGSVTVTQVQRIQNPHLYHQYLAKKDHMDKQNPGIQNEKSLWHGTAADAIDNINHHGFNRSFCGKNATVYGEGVYFAINANYSASPTYSPPDTAGNRHVYLCKVLVGHPITGNRSMRVLPARQGQILYDSATDNPNSPSMYVIFHDTQAYPEYLITFT